jgi:hypothetical protein
MRLLFNTARWELIFLVTAIGALTIWKLFNSAGFGGLLRASDGTLSPGRMQMLVLTVITALQYLLATIHDPSHLHALPAGLVMAMGGSQLVYLAAKAWSLFGINRNSTRNSETK